MEVVNITGISLSTSSLFIIRQSSTPLVLDGQDLELLSLTLDEHDLPQERYRVTTEQLIIDDVPATFTLAIQTRIRPQRNTALEGLYKSNGMFCTQCEAEGFRRITYFPDRPDVMSRFTTTIVADRRNYPVLLSNGNPVERGVCDNNRHWVRWVDLFPKPSYLFALVAGDLVCTKGTFTTMTGREIQVIVSI